VLHTLYRLIGMGTFSSSDVDREKLIVLQEMQRRQDRETILFDFLLSSLFAGHPLGQRLLGTPETLFGITAEDISKFHARHYTGNNLVVAVCGPIDADRIAALIEDRYGSIPAGFTACNRAPASFPRRQRVYHEKALSRRHVLAGIPAPGCRDGGRFAVKLIDIMLGVGNGSLLYQRLRLEKSLIYSASSYYTDYEDAGCLAIRTSCDDANLGQLTDTVGRLLTELHRDVTQERLCRAKRQYAGRLYRSFETTRSITMVYGIEELLGGAMTFAESVSAVEAVTVAQVREAAATWLADGPAVTVVTGGAES